MFQNLIIFSFLIQAAPSWSAHQVQLPAFSLLPGINEYVLKRLHPDKITESPDGKIQFRCENANLILYLKVIKQSRTYLELEKGYNKCSNNQKSDFSKIDLLYLQDFFYRLGVFYGFFYGATNDFLEKEPVGQTFMDNVDSILYTLLMETKTLELDMISKIQKYIQYLVKTGYKHGFAARNPTRVTGPVCPFGCAGNYAVLFNAQCPFTYNTSGLPKPIDWQSTPLFQPGVPEPDAHSPNTSRKLARRKTTSY